MFDLDRLAAFDRVESRRTPPAPQPAPGSGACSARSEREPVLRCAMIDRLGVEPLCPFARVEAA